MFNKVCFNGDFSSLTILFLPFTIHFVMSDFNGNFTKEKGECSFVHFIVASVLFICGIISVHLDFSFLGEKASFLGGTARVPVLLSGIFYLIAFLLAGRNVILAFVRTLFTKEENPLNEMLLFTVASVTAVLIEQFSLAVELMLFFQFGKILEKTLFVSQKEGSSKFKSIYIISVLIFALCLAIIPNVLISFGVLNQKAIFGKSSLFFWSVALLSASSFLFVIINLILKMINRNEKEISE